MEVEKAEREEEGRVMESKTKEMRSLQKSKYERKQEENIRRKRKGVRVIKPHNERKTEDNVTEEGEGKEENGNGKKSMIKEREVEGEDRE